MGAMGDVDAVGRAVSDDSAGVLAKLVPVPLHCSTIYCIINTVVK